MRVLHCADVVRQPGPYIWVLPAENPLGLGSLYVRKPFSRKGKIQIRRKVSGNLSGSVLGKVSRNSPSR